ncbi:MAG: hypothetical protein M1837_004842 [Sclerophora amabilis]|nr:MAG: hypothetical protein M1837_004842 [Sclerophora amabilis]
MTTHGQFNTKSPTIKRILREATELSTSPSPDYHAHPLETNLFEWHFTLSGPPSPSPYASGLYHGRIILPATYPLRPPSFRFLTPTGRFEVNREICLSISGHHEETWQPAWGIRTALVALRSFMDQEAKGQLGGLDCDEGFRKRLAKESRGWKCSGCGGKTNEEVMREVAGDPGEQDKQGKEAQEVEIPQELRMGYKDEIGAKKEETKDSASDAQPSKEPELPTPPQRLQPSAASSSLSSSSSSSSSQPAQPPQRTQPAAVQPQPTRVIRLPPQQERALRSDDGIPAWIDKTIGGLFACLVVMILKKMLEL